MIHRGQVRKRKTHLSPVFFAFLLFPFASVYAENVPVADPDQAVLAEVQRLQDLKQNQPEKYRREIQARRQHLHSQMADFRRNPEFSERFRRRTSEMSERHAAYLRARRPDLYPRFAQRRSERIERMQTRREPRRVATEEPKQNFRRRHPPGTEDRPGPRRRPGMRRRNS